MRTFLWPLWSDAKIQDLAGRQRYATLWERILLCWWVFKHLGWRG